MSRHHSHANSARQARVRCSYLVTENELEKCAGGGLAQVTPASPRETLLLPRPRRALPPLLPLPWVSASASQRIENAQPGVCPADARWPRP